MANVTSFVIICPSRNILNSIVSPAAYSAIKLDGPFLVLTSLLPTFVIISPSLIPALSAGLPTTIAVPFSLNI